MSYSRAIYRIDLISGSDANRTGFTGSIINSGGFPSVTASNHGLVDGAVVNINSGTYVGAWLVSKTDDNNFTLCSSSAYGYVYISGSPAVNDTLTVGSSTFTFSSSRDSSYKIVTSADSATLSENIATALQTDVSASIFAYSEIYRTSVETADHRVYIRNRKPGTVGNSVTFTKSSSALVIDGNGTLSSGSNATFSVTSSNIIMSLRGGSSWPDAWLTPNNGATSTRIQPDDIILFGKTPAPKNIGNGLWYPAAAVPGVTNIVSSSATSPIIIYSANHGLVTNDSVQITGHLVNREANGTWSVTVINSSSFSLDGSLSFSAVTGSATGTARKANFKCVVMDSIRTQVISNCQTAWTTVSGSTATLSANTDGVRQGDSRMTITLPAIASSSSLYAYIKLPITLDLSNYQNLSFYSQNSVLTLDNTWKLALCSDISGSVIVDEFQIPAMRIATISNKLIPRVGGGSLGSNINSIALYSGTITPANASSITLDHIIATKTDDINLTSIITRNSLEIGNEKEIQYSITNIGGKAVYVWNYDIDVESFPANVAFGYSNRFINPTSGSSPTYIRNPFTIRDLGQNPAFSPSISGTQVGEVIRYVSFQGGWNTITEVQEGLTLFCRIGAGLLNFSQNYIILNRFGGTKGVYFGLSGNYNLVDRIQDANRCQISGYYNYVDRFGSTIADYNGGGAFARNGSIINRFSYLNSVTLNSGPVIVGKMISGSCINGMYTIGSGPIIIENVDFANLNAYPTAGPVPIIYKNCFLNTEPATGAVFGGYGSRALVYNNDKVEGNHWIFEIGATMNLQSAVVYGTETRAWKTSILLNTRLSVLPVRLKIAEVAMKANKLVTVTTRVKKDSALGIGAKLITYANITLGIPETFKLKANDTNWEELTISFTPIASGVQEIYLETWYITALSNSYVGALIITQQP